MKSSVSIATRTPARTAIAFASLGLTLVLALTGCTGDGTTFGDTNGAPSTGVYVIQNTPAPSSGSAAKATSTTAAGTGTILQFSTSASGAATPVSTIANLNVTSLAFLAVDGTGDIYTAATDGTTVLYGRPTLSLNPSQLPKRKSLFFLSGPPSETPY